MYKNHFKSRMSVSLVAFALFLQGCQLLSPETRPAEEQAATTKSVPKTTKQTHSPPPSRKTAKPAPKVSEACSIKLTAPKDTLAQEYYIKGERLFNDDDVSNAKRALQTATCLDPKHKQATELLDLLEKTYPGR